MNKRTTDQFEGVVANFFKTHQLEDAVVLFMNADCVMAKLAEGHKRYQEVLTEAEKTAPEGVEEIAKQVIEKLTLERDAYDQKITEVLKEKICDIFNSAMIYLDIRDQLVNLLVNAEDENLIVLLESAMDDTMEGMTCRFGNLVSLLIQGMPMEIAEKIADEAGDAIVCPIGVTIHMGDDEDDEECEGCEGCCDGECDPDGDHCNGECGCKCSCEGKDDCETEGCCHNEDPRD